MGISSIELTGLQNRIRVALDDTVEPYTYTTADIESMTTEALEVYTAVFPLPYLTQLTNWQTHTPSESPDDTLYFANSLPDNFRIPTAVYNSSNSGRLYDSDGSLIKPETHHYTRLDYRHPNFFRGRFYDIRHGILSTTATDNKIILLSVGVATGEQVTIEYLGSYVPTEIAEEEVITIENRHIPIITAYCQAAFARRRALVRATETATGNVYQIAQAARDITTHYNQLMREAKANPPSYLTLSSNTPIPRLPKSSHQRWS